MENIFSYGTASYIREHDGFYLLQASVDEGIDDEVFIIPEEISGVPVVGIKPEAFEHSSYRKVILPDSIEYIGERAFSYCMVKDVEFGKNLKEIGDRAFSNNFMFEKLVCPKSLRRIGEDAFGRNVSLQEVVLNDGLEDIGDKAFFDCPLEYMIIPKSVKLVGYSAFVDVDDEMNVIFEGRPVGVVGSVCYDKLSFGFTSHVTVGEDDLIFPRQIQKNVAEDYQDSTDEELLLGKSHLKRSNFETAIELFLKKGKGVGYIEDNVVDIFKMLVDDYVDDVIVEVLNGIKIKKEKDLEKMLEILDHSNKGLSLRALLIEKSRHLEREKMCL